MGIVNENVGKEAIISSDSITYTGVRPREGFSGFSLICNCNEPKDMGVSLALAPYGVGLVRIDFPMLLRLQDVPDVNLSLREMVTASKQRGVAHIGELVDYTLAAILAPRIRLLVEGEGDLNGDKLGNISITLILNGEHYLAEEMLPEIMNLVLGPATPIETQVDN